MIQPIRWFLVLYSRLEQALEPQDLHVDIHDRDIVAFLNTPIVGDMVRSGLHQRMAFVFDVVSFSPAFS